jgi:hypothetical protein
MVTTIVATSDAKGAVLAPPSHSMVNEFAVGAPLKV